MKRRVLFLTIDGRKRRVIPRRVISRELMGRLYGGLFRRGAKRWERLYHPWQLSNWTN